MYTSPAPTTPTKSPLLTPIAEYDFMEYRREELIDDDIIASQNKYEHLYCFMCPSPRKFVTKAGKVLHQKTHLKELLRKQRAEKVRKPKLYSCKGCDELFTKREFLNIHTKSHENRLYCDFCRTYFKDRFDFELQHAILAGESLAGIRDTTRRTRSQSRAGAKSAPLNHFTCLGTYYAYSDYESDVGSYKQGITRPSTSLSMSRFHPRKRKKVIDDWIDDYNISDVDGDDECFDTVSLRSVSRASSKFARSRSRSRSRSRLTDGSVSPPSSFSNENYRHNNYLCSEEQCFKLFPTLYWVTIHEMAQHKKLALFRCTGCRLRFTTSENLMHHKELKHPLDTIECVLCDMKISGVTAIRDHVNLHRGYSAKCEICSKVFLSKYYLDEHLKDKSKHSSYKKSKTSILIRITYATKKSEVTHYLDLTLFDSNLKFISYTELFSPNAEDDKNSFHNRINELNLPWRC